MKTLLVAFGAALVAAVISASYGATANTSATTSWRLAYAHDGQGRAIEGSKQALVDAVLEGKPVRIYWTGRTVQHVSDAGFLTLLQGEVFAQIPMITAQRPSTDPATVDLRDGTWQSVFATNGDRALRWFVQN
ncbi:hypothetical protein [Kordiimonas sp.]|uniref:hypothetical protein n=1 Tax=Kordiimonas sp. TaxID=1970157 RepID=UPI003A8D3649